MNLLRGQGPLNVELNEPLVKFLTERGSCHSGQAKRDPESRTFNHFWIPAFAGMTEEMAFAGSSNEKTLKPGQNCDEVSWSGEARDRIWGLKFGM